MPKYGKKVEFQGYLDVYLSKEQKMLVKERPLTNDQIIGFFQDVADDGYKVSVSYDHANQTYICTLYGNHRTEGNAGYVLSQRHGDIVTALSALHFMHTEVFDGDWPTTEDTEW